MNPLKRQLRIRISEEQFKKLADVLIEEQMKKSSLIREALDNYLLKKNLEKDMNEVYKAFLSRINENKQH